MDDRSLIALLNERNDKAIEMMADSYGGLCRSIISNILNDRRDVEECLNSVFMKMWQSIPPAEPRDLKAYIAKAARNEALTRLRANKKQPVETGLPFGEIASFLPPVESEAEAAELTAAINRFLHTLSKEKRTVFLRRYWYFDSIDRIVNNTGMSRSKVTSMLFRMRNELRASLEREGLV